VAGCSGDPGCNNNSGESEGEKIGNFFNAKVLLIGGILLGSCFLLTVISSCRPDHGDDDDDEIDYNEYEMAQAQGHGGNYREL
jgi:hypothetical protein